MRKTTGQVLGRKISRVFFIFVFSVRFVRFYVLLSENRRKLASSHMVINIEEPIQKTASTILTVSLDS